jgi:hypothetical protein
MRKIVIAASVLLLPLLSQAAVLNFEGFTAGTFLSTEYQASSGIVFTDNARIYFLGTNHATSGDYGIFNSGTSIAADFILPGDIPAATNSVTVYGDLIPIGGTVTLQAYDINDNLIGSDVELDSPAPATLTVNAPGIHRIVFFSQTGTVAFDDLTFNTPTPIDAEAIPEPASMALLLSGGLLLFTSRRLLAHR